MREMSSVDMHEKCFEWDKIKGDKINEVEKGAWIRWHLYGNVAYDLMCDSGVVEENV